MQDQILLEIKFKNMLSETIKINTLLKLINFIKYDNEDEERLKELAGSPIVGEIMQEAICELYPKIGREVSFDIENRF